MKEVFKKLFGLEPMSAQEREAFALGAVVIVSGWLGFGLAVLLC